MTILFISDLHLTKKKPQLTCLFKKFLNEQAIHAESLYILGDFFDAWIGDDDDCEYYLSIIDALKQLSDTGVPIYFMVGNRDFLVGKRFCRMTGCQLLKDPVVIDLYGIKTLLKHGDDLCLDDKSYLLYRKIVRNLWVKMFYLALPLKRRRNIAAKIRNKSQQKEHQTVQQILDIPEEAVTKVMATYGVNQFIHGHTHRPSIHYFQWTAHPKVHIVLSDWGESGNVLVCEPGGQFRLDYFKA